MATCPSCGTRYNDSQRLCPKDGDVLEPDQVPEQAVVGRVLDGKYRLDSYLSRGGMGAVYVATHVMLGHRLAVKLISSSLVSSPDVVRRFQREARAVTQLTHPHIVRVYDLGETEDGTLYIAMDLLSGKSLSAVINETGPLPPARIVTILRQILSALGLAHRNGVVHRDLKPHNIMIGMADNGGDFATLLDFGIAKTFEAEGQTKLTATGFLVGTPNYMSPEQAAGQPVDNRSDLYSMGVILYEMLVGEVPFNDPSTPAILIKHVTEVPVRPSIKRPDLNIDPVLEAIAMRCLEKRLEHRYQTAEDVASFLPDAPASDQSSDATIHLRPSLVERSLETLPTGVAHLPNAVPTALLNPTTKTLPVAAHTPEVTSLAPTRKATLVITPDNVALEKPRRSMASYAVVGAIVISGVTGAALLLKSPSDPTNDSTAPRSQTAAPTGDQRTVVPPVLPAPAPDPAPPAQQPVAADPNPPASQPSAPSRVTEPPAPEPRPAVRNDAPPAGDALSSALTTKVRTLMREQNVDASRFRSVKFEMTTRPSSLGRGITADYVATVRTAAGERTFPGNHLGFGELTLRNEVLDKVAAEIVAALAKP